MPKTPGKQSTLFSFFNKQASGGNSPRGTGVLGTKNVNQCSSPSSKPKANGPKSDDNSVKLYDVVWAKLDGFPWWPSIVCNHPTKNSFVKKEKKDKHALIHVQFFDNPPTRSWIKRKNIKPFTGSDHVDFQRGGCFYNSDPDCYNGALEADKALTLESEDRKSMLVELQPSEEEDEEDEDEEPQKMKLDSDIFDSEEDKANTSNNSSKENNSLETSPSKAGGKRVRAAARKAAKRRKIIESGGEEESGDEFKPGKDDESDGDDDDSSGVDEDEEYSSESLSDSGSPVKKKPAASRGVKRKKVGSNNKNGKVPRIQRHFNDSDEEEVRSEPRNESPASPAVRSPPTTPALKPQVSTPLLAGKTKSKLASFAAPDTPSVKEEAGRTFSHFKFDFLKPDNMKDINKVKKGDPNYDPRTLYVPESFLNQQTPAMRQWWELKAKHFDVVLFFKMGKFYELFHMDAMTAVNELGIIYMKGDHAHAGFPEIGYGRYSETLIQKGYKVARIEQTETPDMMSERVKKAYKPTKFDKVVRREICRITSRGTKVYSFIDGECCDSQNAYLMAFCEKEMSETGNKYGVCFLDTSIGKIHFGQFTDDRHCSRLRTLISHFSPVQVLMERGKLTDRSQQVVKNCLTNALKEVLKPGTEFWESSKTLKYLSESDYFKSDEKDGDGKFSWPEGLKPVISDSDSLGHTAADNYELAVRSLGAVIWYLKDSCLDDEILSMKNFVEYKPLDIAKPESKEAETSFTSGRQHMVLDSVTLTNLDVFENSTNGSDEGTLMNHLNRTATAFGKRLFKQWLSAPLCNISAINDRLDAVEDLMNAQQSVTEASELLKKLPDLQRLLSKIHTLGLANRSQNHPEGRAIFFDADLYSKRKIEDFIAALEGFQSCVDIMKKFSNDKSEFKSNLLKKTVSLETEEPSGAFPDLEETLLFFKNAFDHKKAREAGVINPSKGVDKDYDTAKADIALSKKQLEDYLESQKNRLGCRTLTYVGTAKNRYQIEVPESSVKNVPGEYEVTSSRKGFKRYWSAKTKDLLAQMMDAEDRRDTALRDVMRRIFHQFDQNFTKWDKALQCISVLDVLISLASYSRCAEGVVCRPVLQQPTNQRQPFLEIRDGRHPCITDTFSGGDFIPNDTVVGIQDEKDTEGDTSIDHSRSELVLVTGPNMGGKSTLMRQVGLIVVMAQLGCYVPAEKCQLTPVDRLFTRLGASDRIMAGESTFFVELSETSAILQHATKHSLVLLDELGRGTATYDGTAIACGVVHELSQNIGCRTLFSTHYHSLVEEFSHDPNVRLGHMACMVENENCEDPSQETITFLYKFTKGACPKSYGFNAARLANIPEKVIQLAVKKAKEFEYNAERGRLYRKLQRATSAQEIRDIRKKIMQLAL